MGISSPSAGGGCRRAPGCGGQGPGAQAWQCFRGVAEIRSGRDPETPLTLLARVPGQDSSTPRALCQLLGVGGHNDEQ